MESKQKPEKDKKSSTAANAKRLLHILRAVYYVLRNSITKSNLLIDLKLKLHHRLDSLSCRSVDPNAAFFSPREIEFSCSNTPSHSFLHRVNSVNGRRKHRKRFDVDEIARAFEFLDSSEIPFGATVPSPSPVAVWRYARSPMVVRQLRVTDSPFPTRDEEGEDGGSEVDREAEEFIRRFYEQLRLQPVG